MTSIINEWRIFCITENSFVTGLLTQGTACEVCFNNNTHIVNYSSSSIIRTIEPNLTILSTQSPNQTNGNFRREGLLLVSPNGTPGTITTQTTSFPYPVGMLAFNMNISVDNVGDMIEAVIMPIGQAPIDVLAINLEIGTKIIPVNDSVFNYVQIGFQIVLINNLTGFKEECDEIISINKINKTVTLKTGIKTAFNMGCYISFLMKRCKNIYMTTPGIINLGNFLRSSLFPMTLQAQIRYTNNSGTAKTFAYSSDYLF